MNLINATSLNLIDFIHPRTGASVAMWRDIYCCPVEWRKYFIDQD